MPLSLRKCLGLLLLTVMFLSCRAQRSPNTPTRPFDPKSLDSVDHRISPTAAAELVKNFRARNLAITGKQLPLSEAFNKRQVLELLAQENCVGIRVSYGLDAKGSVRIVLFGIDSNGRDIGALDGGVISKQKGGASFGDPIVLENGQRCPELCPDGGN